MKFKIVFSISILCILFLSKCVTDFSPLSSIKLGVVTIKHFGGFDFSHDRIIDFRNVDGLTEEEKKKAIDLFFYTNYDISENKLLGPPLFVELLPHGFKVLPDSSNPSINNLDISDINQVSDVSNLSYLPDILFNNIDDVLSKPVFAIKTIESNYAIFEITEIDSNFEQISFKWKYQTNGSSEF